ncbi:MAG: YicC family protein [Clostridia bacterium]|nr:YicC family protein [Clostridia bacterium]
MIKSMTAYGRAVCSTAEKDITVEIKSVNNRYFDCSIRTPRIYSPLEEKIRAQIQQSGISRGKIDVNVSLSVKSSDGITVALDRGYAESYISALRELRDEFSLRDDISVMGVAANRDLFTVVRPEEDSDKDWAELCPVLDEAIASFNAMRAAEGERLMQDLASKKANLVRLAAEIKQRSETDIAQYKAKLEARLRSTLENLDIVIDEARILTECAIFADRVAIDEELVRLASHFAAFDEMLLMDIPVGRKIDFLLQEMNREVNTTGSKCSDSEIAHMVVDMKAELEKIREQIQNIE